MLGITSDRVVVEPGEALDLSRTKFGAPSGTSSDQTIAASPAIDPDFEALLAQSSIAPVVPEGRILGRLSE